MDHVKIGRLIRRLRQEQCLTQLQLAEQMRISHKTVSKWERAESVPDAFVLKQLGEIFGVSVDYLLGLSESSIPNQPPTPEMRAIISSYSRANAFTRKMVWMQLEPAMTEDEKSAMPEFIDTSPMSEEPGSDMEQSSDDE